MTRKDYELIAAAFDSAQVFTLEGTNPETDRRSDRLLGVEIAARKVGHALRAENPRFDSVRFLEAALNGPQYRKAVNAENLARELGPGRLTSGVEGD